MSARTTYNGPPNGKSTERPYSPAPPKPDRGAELICRFAPPQASPPKSWGVYCETLNEWAFAGGMVVNYPEKEIAETHAKALGAKWRAKGFASLTHEQLTAAMPANAP